MKTINLNKIDLDIQYAAAFINLAFIIAGIVNANYFVLVVMFQACINIYHFITNFIHISVEHKSLGFTKYRHGYTLLTLIYVPVGMFISYFIVFFLKEPYIWAFYTIVWLIIPQVVLHLYIYLCKKEVEFIEQNEFHILK